MSTRNRIEEDDFEDLEDCGEAAIPADEEAATREERLVVVDVVAAPEAALVDEPSTADGEDSSRRELRCILNRSS